jgi:hypothetical protein
MSVMDKCVCAHGDGRKGTHVVLVTMRSYTTKKNDDDDSNNNDKKPQGESPHCRAGRAAGWNGRGCNALLLSSSQLLLRPYPSTLIIEQTFGFVGWYSRSKTGPKHRTGNI